MMEKSVLLYQAIINVFHKSHALIEEKNIFTIFLREYISEKINVNGE